MEKKKKNSWSKRKSVFKRAEGEGLNGTSTAKQQTDRRAFCATARIIKGGVKSRGGRKGGKQGATRACILPAPR